MPKTYEVSKYEIPRAKIQGAVEPPTVAVLDANNGVPYEDALTMIGMFK